MLALLPGTRDDYRESLPRMLEVAARFPELQAIMLQGNAKVLETAEEEAADPHLAEVRVLMGQKYNGGHGRAAVANPAANSATAGGRNRRWIVLAPTHVVSWDNYKLPKPSTS